MVLKLKPCVKISKKSSKSALFSGDQMVLRVSPKLTMRKALLTCQEMAPSDSRAERVEFKASRG